MTFAVKTALTSHLMSSTQGSTAEEIQEQFRALEAENKKSSKFVEAIKFLPFALITSVVCLVLYVTVGGVDLEAHLPFVAGAYAVGVIGLTIAYANVSRWILKQKSGKSFGEAMWFSLFYNNAFYVALLMICSSFLFSSFKPTASVVLTQLVSVGLPVWLSSRSA